MHFQIDVQAFQFLEESFLKQLKEEYQSRSRPSKSVLQALKHLTSLNKQFKSEIQYIKNQLQSSHQEKQFLKQMIDNLNNQLDFIKNSKTQKLKKLCAVQTQLHTQVEFLQNQRTLLKKQIQILKQNNDLKTQSLITSVQNLHLQNLSSPQNQWKTINQDIARHQGMVKHQGIMRQQDVVRHQGIYRDIVHSFGVSNYPKQHKEEKNVYQMQQPKVQKVQETQIEYLVSQTQLQQSGRFNEYVNFQQNKQGNQQTRANSKLKIDIGESRQLCMNQKNNTVYNKTKCIRKQQCQELTKMLFLRKNSSSSGQNLDEQQSHHFISSMDEIQPKIIQITSEQEILIQQSQRYIETPTLKICKFNPKQSTFLMFANQKVQEQTQKQTHSKGRAEKYIKNQLDFYPQAPQYTFLQLQTRKSIEQTGDHQFLNSYFGADSIKISQTSSKPQTIHLRKNIDDQFGLQDISGVDYHGLLDDIYQNQNELIDHNQKPQSKHKRLSKQNLTLADVNSKRTTSLVVHPREVNTLFDSLNRGLNPACPRNINSSAKQKQKVKIVVHPPGKYINVTQSYKTIDLDKASKNEHTEDSFDNNFSLNPNGNASRLNEKSKMDCSTILSKSRAKETNKMSNSRVMNNSKLMMFSNNRLNKQKTSQSPVSIQRQKKELSHFDSKSNNSYSIVHSTRSKRVQLIPSNNKSCFNTETISNNPSVIKRYDQDNNKHVHPVVSFKQLQTEVQQKYLH